MDTQVLNQAIEAIMTKKDKQDSLHFVINQTAKDHDINPDKLRVEYLKRIHQKKQSKKLKMYGLAALVACGAIFLFDKLLTLIAPAVIFFVLYKLSRK